MKVWFEGDDQTNPSSMFCWWLFCVLTVLWMLFLDFWAAGTRKAWLVAGNASWHAHLSRHFVELPSEFPY